MNLDLMQAGLAPVIFRKTERLAYYKALDEAHTGGDYRDFLHLSLEAEIRALEDILALVRGNG